jgi:transposase
LRYPRDLISDKWVRVEPLIPPARRGGNKRHVDVREVMNGIMYILKHGMSVARGPERPAAALKAVRLSRFVVLGRHARSHALYVECREQDEREASPTAAIIDSQSVKSAEKGGQHRSAWL